MSKSDMQFIVMLMLTLFGIAVSVVGVVLAVIALG